MLCITGMVRYGKENNVFLYDLGELKYGTITKHFGPTFLGVLPQIS